VKVNNVSEIRIQNRCRCDIGMRFQLDIKWQVIFSLLKTNIHLIIERKGEDVKVGKWRKF
jgi:hypothetical protein